MEEIRGIGSYIWGKSVHNIRIERLWVDVTKGFGSKWKTFFEVLEAHDGLNVDNDAHIWLLHHLFLDKINADATAWTATWNSHTMSRRGQSHQSPEQMYVHGIVTNGVRGVHLDHEDAVNGNLAEYGIDWEELDRPAIHRHHDAFNPGNEVENENPFTVNHPDHLSHVEVPDAHCPFNAEQLHLFNTQLQTIPTILSLDMHSNRLTWINALALATEIVQV
ncbi:hypothetical protein CPB84DRAFT_1812055 [Gymnopilus junonius]|uniref:Integrase core domain-containing protein n=1 Tax=Gymnopilus junonius TaxID=109634 RepID=A0A9P5P192_GYMJU|nr:hypothetical protein CPB84DRAFT_1812055 [Gymnopilus junonius]